MARPRSSSALNSAPISTAVLEINMPYRVVYVLQISDDIDKPVAFATELHAKDGRPSLRTIGGMTLDPWVTGDDGSFMLADPASALFTIYRCPVHES
jgi:hypothetical protein